MRRNTNAVTMVAADEATTPRLWAKVGSQAGVLAPPWLLLAGTAGAGALSHAVWGDPGEVTWAAVAATLGTTGLSSLTWAITHARRLLGRVHASATVAATGAWLTTATVTGLDSEVVTGALWWGGAGLALSWNLRTVIRRLDPDQQGGADALATLFDKAKDQAGLKGARARATQVTDRKIKGVVALAPGEATVHDAQRSIGKLESGMQVPPGTLALAANPDRADLAEITVSDPRVLRTPIPWPGPSRPGASVAEPLRVGGWQDGDDGEFILPGRHLQVMGMSGSGKSFGSAWNTLAELMTRRDVQIIAIDTSKDEQTLGPLKPGLAALVTDQNSAVEMLRRLHRQIPERTKTLGRNGYSKWSEGCGMDFVVLWIEEASKFLAALSGKDEERFEEIVKEARSAGVAIVLSLQRSDYTQMPTLVRGQLSKWCFGLGSSDDAKWGLSTRQQKVDTVAPEEWEANYPGMSYLDAQGVSEKHAMMPLRCYSWGETTYRDAMAAHLAEYHQPHAPDPLTARLLGPTATDTRDTDLTDTDDEDTEEWDVAADELDEAARRDPELADPDTAVTAAARPDTPIQHPTAEEAQAVESDPPARRATPAQSRAALHDWLTERVAAGHDTFTASDPSLAALRHHLGMGRSWTYKVLGELQEAGRLTVHNGVYTIEPDTDHTPDVDTGQLAA
ncbi:hypothetical protein V5P93_000347 [Actinokineospora auranticolor]|uniref:FtsK domain-containing protein n=1 Tax=Actinokineospora auranticolor TaxID=155976 RepID=A0A2S6GKU7_9PSEU|nr:hypothetical protein [Actinokineospora auranticolor]PPK65766.1 hypothetical protein CLV40_11225 [Actinokineospora auranticolor]